MRGHLDRTLPAAEATPRSTSSAPSTRSRFAGATLVATALGWARRGASWPHGAAFAARERFAANASHELRSPLTVIRTEVEVALADPGAESGSCARWATGVLETVDRMDGLLDDLMLLVRSGAALPRREPATSPRSPQRRRSAKGGGGGRRAAGSSSRPASVRGERRLLERLDREPRRERRPLQRAGRLRRPSETAAGRGPGARCCGLSTAARTKRSTPRVRRRCSSRSSAAAGRATTAARGSGCRSARRSPRRTAGGSALAPRRRGRPRGST